jgi:AcrR family transcriptional regulator
MPMPRVVDHERRKRDIADAVWRVIAEEGLAAVTFRRIAKDLGGSTTLVTEAFSNRVDMLTFAVSSRLELWQQTFRESDTNEGDPVTVLRDLLLGNCPIDPDGLRDTRVWLASIPASEDIVGATARELSSTYGIWLNEQIAELLDRIGVSRTAADHLTITVYGISAAVVENPDGWPRQRIESVIDHALTAAGVLLGEPER